jgi:hypothetical protein
LTPFPSTDIRAYGPVGTPDDSAVLLAAQKASRHVVIPAGVTVRVKDVVVTRDDFHLEIRGDLVGVTGGNSMLTITAARVRIEGPGFIDTGRFNVDYGIRTQGHYAVHKDIKFKGHVTASYIFSDGDYCDIDSCQVLPGYDCSNIPFKMYGTQPRILYCRMEDVRGFNIQFAFCKDALAIGNTFFNPMYIATLTASDAQETFEAIDLKVDDVDRLACQVNGVQRLIKSWAHVNGANYTATVSPPARAGDLVKFWGSRSLENIQFNSECDGGIAELNVCDGTGDSNIVIGGDYHKGVINRDSPGSDVVAVDYPRNIIIRNNICRNAFAASINMSQVIGGQIGGNDCSAWGLRHDTAGGPFNCAIFIGGNMRTRVDSNTLHADESATPRIQYGIGGWVASEDTRAEDFRRRAPTRSIAKQNFLGHFTAQYFAGVGSMPSERKYDMDFDEGTWSDYPRAGKAQRDVLRLAAGKVWQLTPADQSLFKGSLLRVSFLARNSGDGQGELRIFYDNGAGKSKTDPNLTVTVLSADWEPYEILIPIANFGSKGFFLRAHGPCEFQSLDLKYKTLNIA